MQNKNEKLKIKKKNQTNKQTNKQNKTKQKTKTKTKKKKKKQQTNKQNLGNSYLFSCKKGVKIAANVLETARKKATFFNLGNDHVLRL